MTVPQRCPTAAIEAILALETAAQGLGREDEDILQAEATQIGE